MIRIKSISRMPAIAIAFAMAMIMSLAAVRPASAAVVDYTTTGTFTSSGTSTSTQGTDTLTYTSVTSTGNLAPTIISLGEFKISGIQAKTFSDTFTLSVSQFGPTSGSQDFTGTLSGQVTNDGHGDLGSSLTMNFPGDTIVIGGVTYTLKGNPYVVPDALSNGGRVTVEAYVTAVPVPAAAWSGMGLLGLIAAGKLRRTSLFN
jgi:hypothetical protein